MKSTKRTLLVTGGSGRLAQNIIERLVERGSDKIVTTTRSPEKLDHLRARGVEVRKLNFDDPVSDIAKALEGVDRMLMISTHDVGRRAAQHGAVVAAAEIAQVPHILYTSCASPNPNPVSAVVSDHFWSEHAIMSSKLGWTILRHNMYTEHVFLFLPIAVASGEVRASIGDGARSYVTRADCGLADAAAISGDWTDCRIYDIGGPEAVTTDGLIRIAAELTGKVIKQIHISDEEALRELAASGLPPGFPESTLGFDICARHGYHGIVAPAIKELSGHEPETVRSYLERHADVLRAGVPRFDL